MCTVQYELACGRISPTWTRISCHSEGRGTLPCEWSVLEALFYLCGGRLRQVVEWFFVFQPQKTQHCPILMTLNGVPEMFSSVCWIVFASLVVHTQSFCDQVLVVESLVLLKVSSLDEVVGILSPANRKKNIT